MGEQTCITIERLGSRGDGVGTVDGVTAYVPFGLPGERWTKDSGGDWQRVTDGVARIEPVCRHFGTCGGCVAQHMATETYFAWKSGLVQRAFAHQHIMAEVRPLLTVPPGSRRRCALTARRKKGGVVLGYHAARSHTLVDIEACPVLSPTIDAALPGLRELALLLASADNDLRLTVLETRGGLDIAVDGARGATSELRTQAAEVAKMMRLARLTVDDEEIVQLSRPSVRLGEVDVVVRPTAFLQAAQTAESWMIDLVCAGVKGCKSVVDLFCGVGTFSFAIARQARVSAFDSDQSAIAALEQARNRAQGLKPIATKTRDLFREPLSRTELGPFDAAVFDPPRAGAEAQSDRLAASQVPTIVAVSCQPSTLARDARTLIDGGYTLRWVQPIDQFLYSAHVECVALFQRPARGRRR